MHYFGTAFRKSFLQKADNPFHLLFLKIQQLLIHNQLIPVLPDFAYNSLQSLTQYLFLITLL